MKLFISNLATEITTEQLSYLFSAFGKVKGAHVSLNDDGHSRGFGYVLMDTSTAGEIAISALNKRKFMQQFISVSEAMHSERYHDKIAVYPATAQSVL